MAKKHDLDTVTADLEAQGFERLDGGRPAPTPEQRTAARERVSVDVALTVLDRFMDAINGYPKRERKA